MCNKNYAPMQHTQSGEPRLTVVFPLITDRDDITFKNILGILKSQPVFFKIGLALSLIPLVNHVVL